MANTLIQIKRSSTTAVPGSLSSSELAYSYVSDKLFIGSADGLGANAIGGKYFVDLANTIYNQANAAYNTANTGLSVTAAFNAANASFLAANSAFANGNSAYTSLQANWAATNAAFSNANTTHTLTIAAFGAANAAFANGNTAYTAIQAAFLAANSAYNNANSKFASTGGTITGDVTITGVLTLTGNTIFANTETLRISDPLLYLASNNYTTDAVDIGFVGNYVNATGSNVHTGFFRDATSKEYYVFYGYDQEPEGNHINPAGNNFTIAVLNADIRTSNLNLGGSNAILWLNAAYGAANAAFANGNTAYTAIQSSFAAANAAFANGNTNFGTVQAAFSAANAAFNTANGSSNAANITSGTLSAAILVGQYANITGVGTLTGGTWTANTIAVGYGGTGKTSFTTNGVLYGNNAGDLKVTAAGTDGQVLVASAAGVPTFAMLDGGTF